MKFLLTILCVLLAGCAKTSATVTNPETGTTFQVSTLTLWKNVKDAHLEKGDGTFKFDLGESSVKELSGEELAALACLRDRANCQ